MCKFRSVRLKDDLETLLSCCFDLNYVNVVFDVNDKFCECAHAWFATIIWVDKLCLLIDWITSTR